MTSMGGGSGLPSSYGGAPPPPQHHHHHHHQPAHDPYAGMSAEDAAKARREAEAAELDAEVERRRKRVEEWRAKRLAEQQV